MAQNPDTTPRSSSGRTLALQKRRFYLLFLLLLAYLILYPYTQQGGFDYLGFRVFGSATTLLSIFAISFRRSFVLVALLLAIPTLIQRLLLPNDNGGSFALFSTSLLFVFDVFIVVVIFRRVFATDQPNSETIYGALCIYLLVGFGFASMYGMLASVQPHAFYLDPTSNLRQIPDRFDFIYYSFGTMTSLGASGITPVSDQARSISVIEAILGVLYLAVLIARLMGAYQNRSPA
ncbi:MAG: two pore domain potassium channel family protein [Acidobacteriaceae bacterium]|nr:two pore domain potassium channel family protein [Acidobacteriaceae bacterium]